MKLSLPVVDTAKCTEYVSIIFTTKIATAAEQKDCKGHITLYNAECQVFARKLMRVFGSVTQEDIENEVRAVSELCRPGQSNTVVEVIMHGWLPRTDFYFIDMEYCPDTLYDWILRRDINRQKKENLASNRYETVNEGRAPTLEDPIGTDNRSNNLERSQGLSDTIATREPSVPVLFNFESIATILENIAAGLIFIHGREIVHRDLKPKNGIIESGLIE
jgi:serine/threonine protein kinase